MSADLAAYRARLEVLAVEAAGRTDAALAEEVAEAVHLEPAEVRALVPDAEDARRLAELVATLEASASHEVRRAHLVEGIEHYAGPVLAVLERLARR